MDFDEFKHQVPDIDPDETSGWLAEFDQPVVADGDGCKMIVAHVIGGDDHVGTDR